MKARAAKKKARSPKQPVLVNLGCGPEGSGRIPAYFKKWKQVRVDIEPSVGPDIVADLTDLSEIPDGQADAVWAAHCVEHLFSHQVGTALAEFHRVLSPDGFVCITVPDLQAVAQSIAGDRMLDVLYESAAGPITPHDVVFGLGAAVKAGRTSMAHRSGFTPSVLMQRLREAGFTEVMLRRRTGWELAAIARKSAPTSPSALPGLMTALDL